MDEATNVAIELPPIEQAALVAGVVWRVWRSPVVRCDWEPEPFVPRAAPHEPHPIATLGTNMEAMQAAHAYCAAVLARVGESGLELYSESADDCC